MVKDKYFFMTIGMVAIVAGLFGYSYYQNSRPAENNLPPEEETWDGNESKGINQETNKNVSESELEGIESELGSELDTITEDIADTEKFDADNSLDELNTDLTGVGE